MRTQRLRLLALFGLLTAIASPAAAVVITPGYESIYVVGPSISLPDVNAADVAIAGASIFVGQGPFGAGNQSIVRVELDGTTTTVVDNLNSIGGLAYDVAGDRLLFTDNGGNLMGATSGDTIYALPSPRTVGAPVDAATLTLLPSGSIPFAQAILVLPSGEILIGDAAGPGSGRVVKLTGVTPTDFITGLDYVAGLSLNVVDPQSFPQQEIQVGNVNGSFVPSLSRYSLAGAFLGPINQTAISGALDQASNFGGNVLLTGGFTDDFTSSTLVHVAQAGAVDEIASGFGFSSGITVDAPSQRIMVLDFGATHVDTILNVLHFTPGGYSRKECNVETWGTHYDIGGNGKIRPTWTCTDGDPTCDRDLAANGSCDFQVGACASVSDAARLVKCTPTGVTTVTVSSKLLPAAVPDLQAAIDAVLPATSTSCGEATVVTVAADRKSRTLTFDAKDASGKRVDKDNLKLRCLP